MKIVGVNGINTHGEGNIDLVLCEMAKRGHQTWDVELPLRHWFSARWGGRADGDLIARESQDGDILVAHSFGAVRAYYAHKKVEYKAIVLIAPAQGRGVEWWYPDRVFCFHSPKDWVVEIGALLAFHPFGRAGTRGYTQEGIINYERDSDHDDYFQHQSLMAEVCDLVDALARC